MYFLVFYSLNWEKKWFLEGKCMNKRVLKYIKTCLLLSIFLIFLPKLLEIFPSPLFQHFHIYSLIFLSSKSSQIQHFKYEDIILEWMFDQFQVCIPFTSDFLVITNWSARGCLWNLKNLEKIKNFKAYVNSGVPMGSLKLFQPIRSALSYRLS